MILSRIISNGISAPSGLQCSQDSISRSASCSVAVLMSTTFCCSGVGSKKSRAMAADSITAAGHRGQTIRLLALVRFTDYGVPRAQTQPLKAREVRNCLTDEGRPLGVGLQEQAPNHLRRLWPKATVVNAEGKGSDVTGSGDRQEEDRKGTTAEVSKVIRRW